MQADLGRFFLERERAVVAKDAASFEKEEKSSIFPPLVFIPLLNGMRVFECWSSIFLFISLVILRMVFPSQFPPKIGQPIQFTYFGFYIINLRF
jgi:hypothetical protein